MTYEERLKAQEETLLGLFKQELMPDLFAQGYFKDHTPRTLSVLIFGLLGEAGRALEYADDIEKERDIFCKAMKSSLTKMAQ